MNFTEMHMTILVRHNLWYNARFPIGSGSWPPLISQSPSHQNSHSHKTNRRLLNSYIQTLILSFQLPSIKHTVRKITFNSREKKTKEQE